MKTRWTDEQLIEAVKTENTMKKVIEKLRLSCQGSNTKTVKKHIKRLLLDTSHFLSCSEQIKIAASKRKWENKVTTEELLTANSNHCRGNIKDRIIKENLIPYKCNQCEITHWQERKLSLHLDHINGNNKDNRLENLRFLCPNCHSLTDTYCGKQLKGRGRKSSLDETFADPVSKYKAKCIDCSKPIENGKRCISCHLANPITKIEWPSLDELTKLMLTAKNYEAVGRLLGVSGTTIKKRIMKLTKTSNIK
jgi:Zn finger protein HypA/HybF involved in hydrogenase expression